MRKIKVTFVDFWKGFIPETWFVYNVLTKKYDLTIDDSDPDIVFCSCFGNEKDKYENVVKIYYSGESSDDGIDGCDYSMTFSREDSDGKNLYLPLSMMFDENDILKMTDSELLDRKFCNFVYRKRKRIRDAICKSIMAYRDVDCAGKVLHNFDANGLKNRYDVGWEKSKIDFIKDYKFTIAIENKNLDGYITEKLLHPLLVGSVPIYWGSLGNISPFPKNCVICVNDFKSNDDLVNYIKEVDNNDELYLEICKNNPFYNGSIRSYEDKLVDFFDEIIRKIKKVLDKNKCP